MTRKLYYENPDMQQWTAEVMQNGKDENGPYVILGETCFYPEGGGQPADTGVIGPVRVVDVQTAEGEIRHYTEEFLPKGSYKAELDWDRRWDHMQQHAGQHVLSAVFDDVYGMKTTSFHLGAERVSIDLDTSDMSKEQLMDAEKKANAVIQQHIPIVTEWVTQEQAAKRQLRKPPAVSGAIRLVTIDQVDINACGGTHPANTAGIGLIKLISTEKAKAGLRVYFLCGIRAMAHFQKLVDVTDELVNRLNAPVDSLAAAAGVLVQEKADNEKGMKELRSKLLEAEAETLRLESEGGTIEREFLNRPVKELQQLARLTIAAHPSATVLFISTEEQAVRFVCARGGEAHGDMREVLKELLKLTDGKGGGNAGFAQGGGKTAEPAAVFFQAFHSSLKNIPGIV